MSDAYKIFMKPEFTTLKIITSGFQGSPSLAPFDIAHAKSLDEIPAAPCESRKRCKEIREQTTINQLS